MFRTLTIAMASAAVILSLANRLLHSRQAGTADEAKAMLMKAVAAVESGGQG